MATVMFVLFLLTFPRIHALTTLNLTGEWSLNDENGRYSDLRATVPGGIYTDLMANNIIGDVFYGRNDTSTRWVSLINWTYSYDFLVDDSLLVHDTINVVFEGLDTFASISLNNVTVGTSENMFLRYIFDVKSAIQKGNNTLVVSFASPVAMARVLASKLDHTIPPNCPPQEYNGECHVNQIRKMQASFSWDWGPAVPSMGIWKEVYVEAFNSSVIRYLLVGYEDAPNDSWLVTISTILSAKHEKTVSGKLVHVLNTDVSQIHEIQDVNSTSFDTGEVRVDFKLAIPKIVVRRWWPNGYGEQRLYELTTTFISGTESSSKSTKIGFRTVELVQANISSGLSFFFAINGVPVFAKGANEIPLDVLPERGQDPKTVDRILTSAHAANMNMLRVWGGGVYESDYFYQKTDELGLMIWQDFMFACAMYPSHPQFLNGVRAEVRHQVRRLFNHPSIVIWAGNNENEAALMGNWYGTRQNLSLYKQDYIDLYINTIQSEMRKMSGAIFVSSSPSNGLESVQEGYLASNPQNQFYGDVHFYNYLMNSLSYKTYPVPRFVSEFGYQSLPDVDSWLTATSNLSDLKPDSDFMNHRQHHPVGLLENTLLISYQLHLNNSSENYYRTYIFYSQIVQALSIKFETEYYRSFMGRVDVEGRGHTMGALFWQLNDVWIAPTWSSIDYTGKWKMLHYFSVDFFAPTIVTGYLDVTRKLQVYAVSEFVSLIGSDLDASLLIQVYNWNSFNLVNLKTVNTTLEYGKSLLVATLDTDDYLASMKCGSLKSARNNCFFYLTLVVSKAIVAPHNFVLPTALKDANLAKTVVKIKSVRVTGGTNLKFVVSVEATGISLFVWLDSHRIKGRFSENGFVQVTPVRQVLFEAEEQTSAGVLKQVLTVNHLNSNNENG